ncbi:hypothetical protein GCM10022236_21120 [Microlunatus ginsengisoli]|uniref:Uncharacterized protein n=1 Tax=Microlunatus ginsengisoli TaxID=363863 RepID=A0ABP6ZVR5_9ACTN
MAPEPVWTAFLAVTLGGESITVRMIIGGPAIDSAIYPVEPAPRLLERPAKRREEATDR